MAKTSTAAPAVLPDVPAVEDKLNFAPYARTLLDMILSPDTETPLTIGIFGSWGSGKTSLMKMIEAGLKSASRSDQSTVLDTVQYGRQTFPVWFNAWLYSKEETLWRALVMQVLAGVRRIRDLGSEAKAELAALADQLYRAAGPLEPGHLSIKAADLLQEEGASSAQITLTVQHGLDLLENIAQARERGELAAARALRDQVRRATASLEQERIESLARFQAQFEDMIKKHVLPRGYLVVFVDDLDRCLPDKAVEVLETLKLFLDVPGCIFILGIDRDIVERGIRLRYGEMGGQGGREAIQLYVDSQGLEEGAARYRAFLQDFYTDADDVIDGGRYLEKIIQIPFVLPPISPQAMGRFVAELTPNLPDSRCGLVFVRGLEPNPRQVKRALNIFALLWALSQNQPHLAERVSPVRLAKLVVLQQRHGDLYERLRQEPSQLVAWERAFRVRRDREGYQEWAQAAGFDWQSVSSFWSLDAPFPDELEVYEGQVALEILLTMHSLTGEDAKEANFVDMTLQEVRDLVFLTRTVEGGQDLKEKEREERERHYDVPETGPIPLHEFLRLSEEEASFLARQTLEPAIEAVQILERDKRPLDDVGSMITAGRRLGDRLRGHASEVMAALAGQARTVQVLYGGFQGSLMARLPWEMIYDGSQGFALEKAPFEGFWGGRHVIERSLIPPTMVQLKLATRPATTLGTVDSPRLGLVLDWSIDASPAMDLFTALDETGRIHLQLIEEPEALYHSLAKDPVDVYVFYGRGRQEVGESVIGIGKGYPLRSKEILNRVKSDQFTKRPKDIVAQTLQRPAINEQARFSKGTLFYFCLHGQPTQEVDWSAWLSTLAQLGAGGVIAPLIYTPGEWPLQLMNYFFEQLLAGEPVGEALRDARLRLFKETSIPLGLLYVQFGPPALRLIRAGEDEHPEKG